MNVSYVKLIKIFGKVGTLNFVQLVNVHRLTAASTVKQQQRSSLNISQSNSAQRAAELQSEYSHLRASYIGCILSANDDPNRKTEVTDRRTHGGRTSRISQRQKYSTADPSPETDSRESTTKG